MEHRLPRCFPAVHADVKPLRLELLLEYVLDLSDEIKGIRVFLGGQVPDRYNVSLWNNERMTVRNRKVV
jgi:hypothetical protein